MSQDYNSDSDDSYNSDDWDNDGEAESSSAPALRSPDTPGPSTLVPQVIGRNLWVSTHVLALFISNFDYFTLFSWCCTVLFHH
jgi:hypothetical protein